MNIYENIKKACYEKNISIRALETGLGYSNGSLRKYVESAPSNRLQEIAKYLDVSINSLLNTKDSPLVDRVNGLSNDKKEIIKLILDSWE